MVETKEFAADVKRAALFARDSSNITRLKINPGENNGLEPGVVTIEATAEDLGDNVSTINAAVDGPEQQIIFNVKYLAEVLMRHRLTGSGAGSQCRHQTRRRAPRRFLRLHLRHHAHAHQSLTLCNPLDWLWIL